MLHTYSLSTQTASEFEAQYWSHISSSLNADLPVNLTSLVQDTLFVYAQQCHEATLTFTFALNKTLSGKERGNNYLKYPQMSCFCALRSRTKLYSKYGGCPKGRLAFRGEVLNGQLHIHEFCGCGKNVPALTEYKLSRNYCMNLHVICTLHYMHVCDHRYAG